MGSSWGEFFRGLAAKFRDFIKRWGGLIAFALLLTFPFLTDSSNPPIKDGPVHTIAWVRVSVVVLLTLLLIVPVAVQFLDVFTRPLKDRPRKCVRATVRDMLILLRVHADRIVRVVLVSVRDGYRVLGAAVCTGRVSAVRFGKSAAAW